jgi:hypothetical protein
MSRYVSRNARDRLNFSVPLSDCPVSMPDTLTQAHHATFTAPMTAPMDGKYEALQLAMFDPTFTKTNQGGINDLEKDFLRARSHAERDQSSNIKAGDLGNPLKDYRALPKIRATVW